MEAVTRYARSGDSQIAYQVTGEGPVDLVWVPSFFSNIEIDWDLPPVARFLRELAAFSRLVRFDRRGAGMSGGVAGAVPLEEQIDDVRAVIDAVGCEHPALLAMQEGAALAVLVAATHPGLVRALVLHSPNLRTVRCPGYEWAPSAEERRARVDAIVEHWASSSPMQPWANFYGADEQRRRLYARHRRLSMTPDAAAAALAMVGELDVRHALPSVQCPTLVLHRANDTYIDERHSRYAAEHTPGARFVRLESRGQSAEEIERFLTGTRHRVTSDRVLATVLFTDIVNSTNRAAELGDAAWRHLLERHDTIAHEEIARHRGRFVKSLGDGLLATFDGPSRAIDAALAIRDEVRMLGVEIRAGMHTGECELLGDDDIGGLAVHIGARISGLAGAGELLVSSTVRDLTVGSGRPLTERGEHELKGVPGRWRVFAVEA